MDTANQTLRLCIASPSFFPTYGGAQLRFMRYLPGFRERGLEPHVVTGTPTTKEVAGTTVQADWIARSPGHIFPTEEVSGTPVHRVRLPDEKGWRRTIIFNQTLVRFCRDPATRPDVLQLVTNLRPRTIPWLMRLRRMRIPTVYAVTMAPTNTSKKPHKRFLRDANFRRLYNQLDCIITNNSPLRDMVREFGVTTRIEVIPNGVDLQRFCPEADGHDRRAVREALGIPASDRVICTVGAVIPRKGAHLLLEAWVRLLQRFPRTHVILVGPETHLEHPKLGDFRRQLEDLARASGAAERVHFTGVVDNVEAYLRAADLFVLPTEREGLPNSVLEAMAISVPVVITPYIGLSDDIGVPGRHYLLAQPNAEALAEAMAEMLEDPERRGEQGRRGREWVEETMDLDRSLDRYVALYRELASSGSRARKVGS